MSAVFLLSGEKEEKKIFLSVSGFSGRRTFFIHPCLLLKKRTKSCGRQDDLYLIFRDNILHCFYDITGGYMMKKKIIAINGSPRQNGNTAEILSHALNGAEKGGAETELIHLGALTFSGCKSCFSCKLKNGKSNGKCA